MTKKKINTKLGIALAIGSTIVASENAIAQTNENSQGNKTEENSKKSFPIIKRDSIELEKRLKKLANTEYDDEILIGAMCYSVRMPIQTDYICSICNNKTTRSSTIIWEIDKIRNIVNDLESLSYDIILDESEFCKHCRKRITNNPELILKIRFSDNSPYHTIKSNVVEEYKCLYAFLKDYNFYKSFNDGTIPLHFEIKTIKKMTGLGKNIIPHQHNLFEEIDKQQSKPSLKKLLKKHIINE